MTLTEEEVRLIADRQLAEMRPFIKEGVLAPNDKGEFPAPWVGYKEAWEQRRALAVHILNGEFPEHLFRNRAPNQTEAELEWLRKNFKQTTLPVFLDLENTVGRAMHPRNWSIEFAEDEAGEDVREYTEKGIREWGSVYNFMRFAGLRIKVQDAMGVIAVLPTNVSVIEEEDGTQTMDPEAIMEPDIHYFTCEQLWGYEYDKWYMLRLNTNSWVESYRRQQTGVLCWLVDGENVWRIEQVGRPSDWRFDISLEFRHGVGVAPCINLMGTPAVKQGRLVWESPYLSAKDLLDISLMCSNYLEASVAGVMYPVTVMIGDPCDFVDERVGANCVSGVIRWMDGELEHKRDCPSCKGTGQKGRLGPFGKLVINRDPNSIGADQVDTNNALSYVSPPTEALQFVSDHADKYENAARAILHLGSETPMAPGNEKTATEAGLNNRAKDAFVKTIADQLFLIQSFIVECVGKMRHGPEWDGFILRPPTNYDLRTDQDHLNEIAEAKGKELAPWRIELVERDYDNGKYGDDPETLKMLSVISRADRIKNMTMQMVQAEAATGRVYPWEIRLHHDAVAIYQRLMEDAAFEALDESKQVDRLKEAAKLEASKAAPSQPNALGKLAATGTAPMVVVKDGTTPVAGEPVQDTALNGSQVTSLVEIITNISLGRISKQTGQALIRAAFPAMPDALIAQMMTGVIEIEAPAPTVSEPPIRVTA